MTPYYVAYLIIFFCSYIVKNMSRNEIKQRNYFCFVSFSVLFVMLALRHETMGIDLYERGFKIGYLGSFEFLNEQSWPEILKMKKYLNYERGYIIFNKLIGSVYTNRQFFLAVCAFINCIAVIYYINEHSDQPLVSVIVFMGLPVFLIFFSGLRQGIAIAITIWSMKYVENKKLFKFILVVWLATLFHHSSILFLIAYPCYHIRIKGIYKFLMFIGILVVFIFRLPLFSLISKMLDDYAKTAETGAVTLFVIFCAIYVYLIYFNDDNISQNQNGMINLFYIACLCQAFSGVYMLAIRMGYYFMIYGMIAIPNTIRHFKDERTGRFINMIISILFAAFGLYTLATEDLWVIANPYKFFWE